ncbi:MAG: hypothetical protein WAU28_02275 [Candidatus Moraniibacteriota bacterium]
MSILSSLFNVAEGVGVAADISNWLKLKFLTGFLGKKTPASEGGTTELGEKDLKDEHTFLLAAFSSIDVSVALERPHFDSLNAIFKNLTDAKRFGAVEKLRKIIAFATTTRTIKRPTGEKVNNKDVIEEIKSTVNEDGKRIILGLHELGADALANLDRWGILKNARDGITEKAKAIPGILAKGKELAEQYANSVPMAEAVVKERLTKDELIHLVQDFPELKRIKIEWNALPDGNPAKVAKAKEYIAELAKVFKEIRKKRKNTALWVILGVIVTAIILLALKQVWWLITY